MVNLWRMKLRGRRKILGNQKSTITMNLINDLHPSLLFRFLNLRNPEKADRELSRRRFIRYDRERVPAGILIDIEANGALLVPRILAAQLNNVPIYDVRTLVAGFKLTSHYVDNAARLWADHEALEHLTDWLDAQGDSATPADLIAKAEKWLGVQLGTYVQSKAYWEALLRLWDNLLAQLVDPTAMPMEAALSKAIGVLHLLGIVGGDPNALKTSDEIEEVYKAQILIPEWLAELLIGSLDNADKLMLLGGVANIPPTELASTPGHPTAPTSNGHRYAMIGQNPVPADDFCHEMRDQDPCARNPRKPYISLASFFSSMFIGDLLVTKQQLIKYDLGEVAHVENVLFSEKKERIHRRLDRSETTTTFETETVEERETDLTSTERFSVERESQRSLDTDFKVSAGVDVTADFGKVKLGTKADVSFGMTTKESNKDATKFSKDVTTKALEKIKKSVKESKTIKVLNETEETNTHGFENRQAGGDHIVGVYRWVDKFYLNKVVNYGKRLMVEFTIPEPANFYIFSKLNRPATGDTKVKPEHPSAAVVNGKSLKTFMDLTVDNVAFWAAKYGVRDITITPPVELVAVANYSNDTETQLGATLTKTFNTLMVPEGYTPIAHKVRFKVFGNKYPEASVVIGGIDHILADHVAGDDSVGEKGDGVWNASYPDTGWHAFDANWRAGFVGKNIDVTVMTYDVYAFMVSVEVKFQRSPEKITQWQIKTYDAILAAYHQQLNDFEQWEKAQAVGAGVKIEGNNPAINREIEHTELKKRCIEMFSGQRFDSFDAATNGIVNESGYPEILFEEAVKEGDVVKFFEIIFDWANMTYIFYPYFWGRKPYWLTTMNLQDNDPTFAKFLQAGYARVVLPVRKGFERIAMNFAMKYGNRNRIGAPLDSPIFNVGVDNDYYISIAEELRSAAGLSEETGTVIGHYVQRVPTNLVYLKPKGDDPKQHYGLPDYSGDPEIKPYL